MISGRQGEIIALWKVLPALKLILKQFLNSTKQELFLKFCGPSIPRCQQPARVLVQPL